MTEEHTTQVREPDGSTHRHTTVVTDKASGTGVTRMLVALLVLIAAAALIYFFAAGNEAEIAKDNAIAGAATQVGETAEQVGNAVEGVADEVSGGE